jgi:hypothetical protein
MRLVLASLLSSLVLLTAESPIAAPVGFNGLKYLGPAPMVVAVRPLAIYDALDEARRLLGSKITGQLSLLTWSVARAVGFDPTTRTWIASAGVDGAAPLLLSLSAVDTAAARGCNRQLERLVRKHLATSSAAMSASAADGLPHVLVTHRLVAKIADEQRARAYVEQLPTRVGAQRAVVLSGKSKADAVASIAALLATSPAEARSLADGLIHRGVVAVVRPDPQQIAVIRIAAPYAIIDVVEGWVGLPTRPTAALVKRLLGALTLPARPALDLDKHKLAARVFTTDAAAAVLINARSWLAAGELGDEREVYRAAARAVSKELLAATVKKLKACAPTWHRASVSDLALQAKGSANDVHLKAFWSIPAALSKALRSASTKDDLVDPTTMQSRVLGLAGANVDLGGLAQALGQGDFKLKPKEFFEKHEVCRSAMSSSLVLGVWPSLVGVLRAEARGQDVLGAAVDHVRSVVVLLRDLYSIATPSILYQLQIGPKGAAKVRETVAKLVNEAYARPESVTVGGQTTVVNRYLKAPLTGYGVGVTDLKAAGLRVALSSRPWDLSWLVQQGVPTAQILPRSVIAFAHLDVGALVSSLSRDPSSPISAGMAKKLARRLDRGGANLTLVESLLSADLHLSLK